MNNNYLQFADRVKPKVSKRAIIDFAQTQNRHPGTHCWSPSIRRYNSQSNPTPIIR